MLPKYQITGAAIVVVISSIWLAKVGYMYCNKYLKIRHGLIVKYFNQTFWPAALMGAVVYILSSKINFLFTIPIGALIYFSLAFLSGALSKNIIINVKNKLI